MNKLFSFQDARMDRAAQFQRAFVLIFILLFVLVVYTFLHESGHAIFGLLFGGTITSFSINFTDAHVGIQGEFSTLQRALISAAGVSLPLLVWAVWMLRMPKKADLTLDLLKVAASVSTINSLLAWIVIPFLYLNGSAPGDDSTNFLNITGIHPLLVSAAALVVYAAGWLLLVSKVDGLRALIKQLRHNSENMLTPDSRRTLSRMAWIGGAVLLLSFGSSAYLNQSNPQGIPGGYTLQAEINLAERAYQDEVVHQINVQNEAEARLFILVENIQRGPAKIRLEGPNGYDATILQGQEDFQIGRATIQPSLEIIEKGEYRLRITFPVNKGRLLIYQK